MRSDQKIPRDKTVVMLSGELIENAREIARRDGLDLEAWLENTLRKALDQSGVSPIEPRLQRIESRLDLLTELLSRMQRLEDRLDLFD